MGGTNIFSGCHPTIQHDKIWCIRTEKSQGETYPVHLENPGPDIIFGVCYVAQDEVSADYWSEKDLGRSSVSEASLMNGFLLSSSSLILSLVN